jgi:hypothetical protein
MDTLAIRRKLLLSLRNMSAKRARKPLADVGDNIARPSKRSKSNKPGRAGPSNIHHDSPEFFVPLAYTEHDSEPRLPDNIELTPLVFFDLFWTGF